MKNINTFTEVNAKATAEASTKATATVKEMTEAMTKATTEKAFKIVNAMNIIANDVHDTIDLSKALEIEATENFEIIAEVAKIVIRDGNENIKQIVSDLMGGVETIENNLSIIKELIKSANESKETIEKMSTVEAVKKGIELMKSEADDAHSEAKTPIELLSGMAKINVVIAIDYMEKAEKTTIEAYEKAELIIDQLLEIAEAEEKQKQKK